jgi:chorismate dehydratase
LERKIRIGAVSYLNTKPMLAGLVRAPIKDEIELVLEFPSGLVPLLKNGEIDIGLVPVAALPEFSEYHIVSDYCISTNGEVASVAVFSQVPMAEIETIILDYQSLTSVMLCKLLLARYWKRDVKFVSAENDNYFDLISGTTAGLIIGDRALAYINKSNYHYDLGAAWKAFTGLPFVFAVWVSVKQLDNEFVKRFSEANGVGVNDIDQVVEGLVFPDYDLSTYFKKNISYPLTATKLASIDVYLKGIRELADSQHPQ